MATVTASKSLLSPAAAEQHPAPAERDGDDDHGLVRFFYAACVALLFSAVQGVVQRMPGISDWLRDADYGGHYITNLAHTHITIVGAGTISLTGLIYYVLPRVAHQPLFSKALTNFSFWATIIGVFGFYIAMLCIGAYEGMMVHAGWPYDAARQWMGAWHKAPMAMTAAIMGLGYWTFVINVYVTVGRGAGRRKIDPANAAGDADFLLAKFFTMAATGLLIGTVQGVYQVLPWSLDWLSKTGAAGHMIDPMAHSHVNLVGGVSVAIMGLLYYFLPRMLGRPIFSMKLAVFSFWCIVIGVFSFYFSAVGLGYVEGSMVLEGLTDVEAKEAVGIWHPLLLALSSSIMGVGFWSFIANILLTLRRGAAADAPPDRRLVSFIGFSVVALLIGTVQGVIQILEPVREWLNDTLPSSYFVTPLSHAQLNMVGFVIIALSTMTIFLLPRILGQKVSDSPRGRMALLTMAVGVSATYAVYFGIGLLESIAIYEGATAAEAREAAVGTWARYGLIIAAQGILAVGYFLLFRHVSAVIGHDVVRAYFRTFGGRIRFAGQQAIRVHPRAIPTNLGAAPSRAAVAFLLEAVGGAFGFLGLGWIYSGRPFIGIMALGSWAGGFWTFTYVVFAVAGGAGLLPVLLVPYFMTPVLSAVGCYRSYMRDVRLREAGLA